MVCHFHFEKRLPIGRPSLVSKQYEQPFVQVVESSTREIFRQSQTVRLGYQLEFHTCYSLQKQHGSCLCVGRQENH